jgi:voltage-gated potassium channel
MNDNKPKTRPITLYDLILMILAFISIFIFFFQVFLPKDDPLFQLFRTLDAIIALVFLADFFVRLVRAESRKQYFFRQFGWLDFLGGIPIYGMGLFRLARLLRGFRVLRHTNARVFIRSLRDQLAQNTVLFTIFSALLALFVAAASVLIFEANAPSSNIHTAEQAVWWAFVTVATVGYGDYYPVTFAGHVTGVLLMVVGVGIFGVISAFLAHTFISPQRIAGIPHINAELAEMKIELAEIRQLLAQIQAGEAATQIHEDEQS